MSTAPTTDLKQIVQGNLGTLYKVGVTGDPILPPNYTCQISVPTAVPPISRVVTDLLESDTRFAIQLTPAETSTLAANQRHKIHFEIANPTLTPEFKIEDSVEFWVTAQVITS